MRTTRQTFPFTLSDFPREFDKTGETPPPPPPPPGKIPTTVSIMSGLLARNLLTAWKMSTTLSETTFSAAAKIPANTPLLPTPFL